MAGRNRDPEREAKRERMSSLLRELKVSSMEDIHDLFKEMIGTFLENGLEGELDEDVFSNPNMIAPIFSSKVVMPPALLPGDGFS